MPTVSQDRLRWHNRLRIEMSAQLDLYDKTKALQCDATDDVDWSRPIRNYAEASYRLYASSISREEFDRLAAERRASTFTPLFFGEQAALSLSAPLVGCHRASLAVAQRLLQASHRNVAA